MKSRFFQYSGLFVAAALLTCSQPGYAQAPTPLDKVKVRLASIEVTPQGPILLYPDSKITELEKTGCNTDGIAISRTKPNFNELYSLVMAAMLAGKTVEISSGDFSSAVCFEYGRATTDRIKIVN